METPELDLFNIKLQPEQNVRAYGPQCCGCIATKMDVMLAFGGTVDKPLLLLDGANKVAATAKKLRIMDIFLTRKQAENLHRELGNVLNGG